MKMISINMNQPDNENKEVKLHLYICNNSCKSYKEQKHMLTPKWR